MVVCRLVQEDGALCVQSCSPSRQIARECARRELAVVGAFAHAQPPARSHPISGIFAQLVTWSMCFIGVVPHGSALGWEPYILWALAVLLVLLMAHPAISVPM